MNLICATSVTCGADAFAPLANMNGNGSLNLLQETDITPAAVKSADAVITRSKTKLNPSLFQGASVRFAGTCTAGIDHADPDALAAMGIHFASAPGCNANAVSEYLLAVLLLHQPQTGFTFHGKTLGIVGLGQVGSRVARKAEALGMRVLRNDPPLQDCGTPGPWTALDDLLPNVDVLTLHVPLVDAGPHPTRNLISAENLARLKPGACLINACRGEVLDAPAAAAARQNGHLSQLILDVWDPEPDLPADILAAADIASPHIAGHSLEGKANGTRQIHDALCEHFGIDHPWDPTPLLPPPEVTHLTLPEGQNFITRLRQAVLACYNPALDDQALRQNPAGFNQQRRNYRDRREFNATTIHGLTPREIPIYTTLGFQIPK